MHNVTLDEIVQLCVDEFMLLYERESVEFF